MAQYSVALVGGPPWGFRISPSPGDKGPTLISQILPNSRASKERIKAGDFILSVNGKSIVESSNSEIQRTLKRASGILRLQLQRGSAIPIPLEEDTAEKEALIQQQPSRNTVVALEPTNQKRLVFLDEAAKRFFPFKTGKVMTSVENLRMTSSPGPPFGRTTLDPTSSTAQDRRWAPVNFTPMGGMQGTSDDVTFHSAPVSHLGRPMSAAAAIVGFIQSAPVTPSGPLSPSHSETSIPHQLNRASAERGSSQLGAEDEEPKISITTSKDADYQQVSADKIGQSLSARASPVPSQPLAITVSSIKRASYRTSRARERFQSLQAVHEGVLLTKFDEEGSVTPTVEVDSVEQNSGSDRPNGPISMEDSGVVSCASILAEPRSGIVPSESNEGQVDDRSYTTSILTGGPSGTLPDGYEFRPESTTSDHPSLATCSLDMDVESRNTDYEAFESGLMEMSGETAADFSLSLSMDDSVPHFEYRERQQTPSMENSRSAPTEADSSVTEDNSKSSFDVQSSLNRNLLSTIPSESENHSEPRYPAAFQNSFPIRESVIKEDLPKPFFGSNYTKISEKSNQEAEDKDMNTISGSRLSNIRGPSFRASDWSQKAVWTPRGVPVSTENHSDFSVSLQKSGNPPDRVTSPGFNYNPIRFVPPYSSTPDSISQTAQSAPFATSTTASLPDISPKPSYSRPILPVSPSASAPPAPPGPGSVPSSGVPPPPPPPPPAVGVGIRPKQEPSYVNPPLAPGERSVIEYPEPRTVASLRSAIQSKLNGSAPVKGVPESSAGTDHNLTQSQQSPPVVSQQPTAPPPPPPAPPVPSVAPASGSQTVAAPSLHVSVGADPPPPPLKVFSATDYGTGLLRESQTLPRRREPSPPRAVSHTSPHYSSGYALDSPTAPPRPPLPMSPLPPAVPAPPPLRPDSYARPYEETSYRGGSVPVSRTGRTPPPPGSVLVERKSSIEGNQVRTDSYYALPKDTASNKRQVTKPEQRYPLSADGGRRTPLANRQPDAQSDDYQHHWYKMMYRKLHQIDRNEDQSILKYHMREHQTSPRSRQYPHSAHLYGRPFFESEPSAYTVRYKYSDYVEDMDYDRGNFFQPYTAPNIRAITPGRTSMRGQEKEIPRSVRSKSAGRYESGSPLPGEVVKSTPAGEKSYRITPKRIEDYVPGDSSLARLEDESAAAAGGSATIDRSSDVFRSWKREKDRLSAQTRQRSSSTSSRPTNYPGTYSSRYYFTMDDDRVRRRDVSPPNQDEVRDWYRSIQTGGEVPYGGLRQTAPERRDSLLRTALHLLMKQLDDSESNLRDSATQVTFSSPNGSTENSGGKRIIFKTDGKETDYGSYWRDSFKPETRTCCKSGINVDTKTSPTKHLYRSSPISPVQADSVAPRYALERAQVADFHIPPFRTSPERKPAFKDRSQGPAWVPPKPDREVDWKEIEAYFTLLNREDKATTTKVRRERFRNDSDQMRLSTYVKDKIAEKNVIENQYSNTCEQLEAALRDIELITPESAKSMKILPTSNGCDRDVVPWDHIMQRSSSCSGGLGLSCSFPNQNSSANRPIKCTVKNGAAEEEAGIPHQFCYQKLQEKFQLIERGREQHFIPMPAARRWLYSPLYSSARSNGGFYSSKSFIARTSSLPYISELSNEKRPLSFSSRKQLEGSMIRSHSTSSLDIIGIASSNDPEFRKNKMKSWISVSDLRRIGVATLGGHRSDQLPPRPVKLEGAKLSASELSLPESAGRVALQRFLYSRLSNNEISASPTTDSAQKSGKTEDDTVSNSLSSSLSSSPRHAVGVSAVKRMQKNRTKEKLVRWDSAPDVSTCRPVVRSPLASFYPSLVYQMKLFRKANETVCSQPPNHFFAVKPPNSSNLVSSGVRDHANIWIDRHGRPELRWNCSNLPLRDPKPETSGRLQRSPSANDALAAHPKNEDYKSPGRTFERPAYNLDYGISSNVDSSTWAQKEELLEEERRKRQEKELEDQRSRRHGFNPLPSRSPGIPSDRFDRILEDPSLARSRSPAGVELRGVARALYSFTAHNPREISFIKGDLIRIRRMIDQNWYEGEFRGKVGIVPVNYVEMAAVAEPESGLSYTEVQETREGQAKATYNFDGRNINELSLRKGEYITLTKRIDSNWFEGKNALGRVGIFPSNYVQVLREPSSQNKNFAASLAASERKAAMREDEFASGGSKMMVNGLPFDRVSKFSSSGASAPILTSTPQSSAGTSGVRRDFRTPTTPKTTANHGLDVKAAELRHTANRLGGAAGRIPQNADTYTTLYSYKPQNPDELELREGDIVYVVERCDDGWFIGTSLRTGMFGTFPGNYVQLMI